MKEKYIYFILELIYQEDLQIFKMNVLKIYLNVNKLFKKIITWRLSVWLFMVYVNQKFTMN